MGVKSLEKFRRFFRFFDLYRVSFSFKYMDEDKYTTSLGGITSLLFFIFGTVLFIINFIPFINYQNFTLQDYIVNTDKTEEINVKDSPMAIAIGFDCPIDSKTQIKAEDLFDLKVTFITYTKDNDGNRNKSKEEIEMHPCNESDFHNEHNESFKFLNIQNLQCLNKKEEKEEKLEGIYTDQKFTYYEFSLIAKKDTAEHYKKIDDYLIENDCKLQFYYTDLTLNLANYENPIKSLINSLFLQINPTLFLKMNVFFMNYHLSNDKVLIPIVKKEKEPLLKTGFSRAEHYFLYKGTDRFSTKPYNYNKYANLYIRVDNKKIEIKRKYQNLFEFYADNSSLLISLFIFINFIISIYNTFKANLSISSRLFFSEEKQNRIKKIKSLNKKDKEKYRNDICIEKNTHNEIKININEEHCETIDELSIPEEIKGPLEKKIFPNKYSFSSIYYCCSRKKKDWYDRAKKILDSRLDIFFYIRKIILLEFIIADYFDKKKQKGINKKTRIFNCIDYNEIKNLKCYYKWSENPEIDNDSEKIETIENEEKENESVGRLKKENEKIENEEKENEIIGIENIDNESIENKEKENEGEIIDNEKIENESIENKEKENEIISNENIDNESADNKEKENQNKENESIENKDNEIIKNENIENKEKENEFIESEDTENKEKENESIENKEKENKIIDNEKSNFKK